MHILCFLSNIWSYCGCPFYVIGYAARFVNFLPACRTNHRLTDGLITDQTTFKARKLFLPFPNGMMQCSFMIWSLLSNTFSPCVAISFARSQSFFYCHTPTINCSLRNIGGLQTPQYKKRLNSCLSLKTEFCTWGRTACALEVLLRLRGIFWCRASSTHRCSTLAPSESAV